MSNLIIFLQIIIICYICSKIIDLFMNGLQVYNIKYLHIIIKCFNFLCFVFKKIDHLCMTHKSFLYFPKMIKTSTINMAHANDAVVPNNIDG